jgi:hypothetical protein
MSRAFPASVRAGVSLSLVACSWFAGVAAAQTTRPDFGSGPLDIGDRRQVFIDGRFLARRRNVELCVHPPRKTGEWVIRPEHPWEKGGVGPFSSVLRDGPVYHMWYQVMDTRQWSEAKEAGCICYARSADGIHWEKPDLGLTEYAGSRKNNIVVGHGAAGFNIGQDGVMVFLDPTAPPDQRFRMVNHFDALGTGIHILSSGDGIHWQVTHRSILNYRPMKKGHHLDSQNVIFWDDRLHKYVAYVRKNLMEEGSQGRTVARAESDKLGGFPMVQDMPSILRPDDQDLRYGKTNLVDYYTSAAIKDPWADDAYYMFPQVYFHYTNLLQEFGKTCPTNAGSLDTQFGASRDGIHWERYDRRPFVPLGMKGEFDWASARMIYGIVPDVVGMEMYMYYRASDWLHGWDRDERNKRLLTAAGLGADQDIAVISRLVSRRDGFVSVRTPYTGGEFTTPLLRFTGSRLALNIDTSATGIGRVEILDEKDAPIDGYTLTDGDWIHTANEINHVVTWRGKCDVRALAGKPIRLHVVLRDSDLYAFQFQN